MLLHTDIPTRAQVSRLLTSRNAASVSIYVPADPVSANVGERIELGNLAADAVVQLGDAGIAKRDVTSIEQEIGDLIEDEKFWRYQARSVAIFATPDGLTTFRLPNRLVSAVVVSDRFHLKPLLRAVTFPQVALVLALAQGSVRLVEVSADVEPAEVSVPDMPRDAASAAGRSSLADRAPVRRIQGSEGRKLRLRQYARQIDQALRPFVGGVGVPMILAATEPLDSIFRSVNSYPLLAPTTITGNPERTPDAELAASAREILDDLYGRELREIRELFDVRLTEGRALLDVGDVARAATFGAIDTVMVDIDEVVPGSIDEQTGAVTLSPATGADGYGVVDEIARRAWLAGARVLAVRRDEIPAQGSVAAVLRYPI
jgi:Bacterial archaeo-eukaryotic release factor family 11